MSRARQLPLLALAAAAASLTCSLAQTPSPPPLAPPLLYPPVVSFVAVGGRALIYDQNPEVVEPEDTADFGGVAHLRIDSHTGKGRVFAELENGCSNNISLGYAVVAVNLPDGTSSPQSAVQVTVTASSFMDGTAGGRPFAEAFNTPLNTSFLVLRGGPPVVLFRGDNLAPTMGDIFTGVLEFESNATIQLTTVVYHTWYEGGGNWTFAALTPQLYTVRQDPNKEDERRVYKGLVATSDVSTAPLLFSVDDTVPFNTTLPVQYPLFDPSTHAYGDFPQTFPGILSNSNPLSEPSAVSTDMLGSLILMPGWGLLDPWGCCDAGGEGSIANQANWGVTVHLRGAVANAGTRGRTLNITLRNTDCYALIAYSSSPASPWAASSLWQPGEEAVLASIALPPAAAATTPSWTPFHVRWVLGGPSCGGEFQFFTVL